MWIQPTKHPEPHSREARVHLLFGFLNIYIKPNLGKDKDKKRQKQKENHES